MKITQLNSMIIETQPHINLYQEGGFVSLYLKKNQNYFQEKAQIENLIQLGAAVNLNIRKFTSNSLIFSDVDRYRELIDMLYRNNYLSNSDRADIEPEIVEVEKILQNKRKINQENSLAQEEALCMIIEPYVEELIALMREFADFIPIWVTLNTLSNSNYLENFYMNKYGISISSETRECFTTLSKILKAEIDLSSIYLRTGSSIPSLAIHKNIILNFFEKKTKEKFPFVENTYKRFYITLSLEKLKRGEAISKRISNKYAINRLTGFPEEDLFKPINILNNSILNSGFFVKKNSRQEITLSQSEEDLLINYDLKRFPISEIDFPLAKNCASSLIKDLNHIVKMIDGTLTFGMTKLEELLFAISTNDSNEIKELVTSNQIDLNAITEFYPLEHARCVETVKVLIQLGADVNRLNQNNQSVLSWAAYNHDFKKITYLVSAGASLMQVDNHGRRAIHQLFAHSSTPQAISNSELVITKMKEMIQMLGGTSSEELDEIRDKDGNNCLLIAAKNASIIGIIALLDLGASPTISDEYGLTPYDIISHPTHPLNNNEELLDKLNPSLMPSLKF